MPEPTFELTSSRQFPQWLAEQQLSLACTTYQAGKLFLIGTQPNGRLAVNERTFNRCLGLWGNGQTLWMSSQYQLWRFENVLEDGQLFDGCDRLFVPKTGHTTGDLDAHDIAIDADGNVVFVNTLFGCLATLSERHSFRPLWKPPFISRLAAEDRCHLNGLAMQHGRPKYVTAVSQSDVADGWRDHRHNGGCVIDVTSSEIVCTGLSMPHSPRLYRDRLWLLNSGTGDFGYVCVQTGKFEPIAFCPGYARGLAFIGKFAVIGLSQSRESTFKGLALDARLAERHAAARCGLIIVNLETGDITDWVRIEGAVSELYDVVTLPGISRPRALGFQTPEIRHNIWFEEQGRTVVWSGNSKDDHLQ